MQPVDLLVHHALIITQNEQRAVIEVEFDRAVEANVLLSIAGVVQAKHKDGNTWLLAHDASTDARPAVFQFAVDNGFKVLAMQKSERGLEEVFKELTRR